MFGGGALFNADQITALVFDIGSSLTKAGYAGEETPRGVFSSLVGSCSNSRWFGDDTHRPRPGMELASPLRNGLVSNWDLYEQLMEYAYSHTLGVDASEHPLMLCEPSWNPKNDREKMCELAFETFNVPGLYLGKNAALSAYSLKF